VAQWWNIELMKGRLRVQRSVCSLQASK